MKNNDFQDMIIMLKRLIELIDEYDSYFSESDREKPLMIPPDIYDEICNKIKQSNITLFGIS